MQKVLHFAPVSHIALQEVLGHVVFLHRRSPKTYSTKNITKWFLWQLHIFIVTDKFGQIITQYNMSSEKNLNLIG